jgi:hypothetical protein
MKRMLLLCPAVIAMGGCTTTMNERPWMGQRENDARSGVVLVEVLRADERPEVPLVDDGPSLTSLDRSNWAPVVVTLPVDGVAAHRSYTNEKLLVRSTARQRGDYPTAVSSVDLSGNTRVEQWAESWLNPGIAFLDLVLLAPRMIAHSPTKEAYAFTTPHWRASTTVLRRLPDGSAPTIDPGTTGEANSSPSHSPASRPETPENQ